MFEEEQDLEFIGKLYVKECYDFYREHAPFKPGSLVDILGTDYVQPPVARVIGTWWSKTDWDWAVRLEFKYRDELYMEDFLASDCARHIGFYPEVI